MKEPTTERASLLGYKDSKSSFEDLLLKDKSFTIHYRNLKKLARACKIDELNKLLYEKQREFEYKFIENDNIISSDHLWRDNIHLNKGTSALANNFIYALNKILPDDYLGN